MSPLFDTREERDLVALARGRDVDAIASDPVRLRAVTRAAREHGVEGVLPRPVVPDPAAITRELALRMQHEARVLSVKRLGSRLTNEGIEAILLKGVGLAERFYQPPWTRGTTDIDLLVRPADLDQTLDVIETLGYAVEPGARAHGFRERHFHVEATSRSDGSLLEVHFLAYRGFGGELTTAQLLEECVPLPGFPGVFVPAPERELVYLAVHAAAHRFMRMGWLHDLLLIIKGADPKLVSRARAFARRVHFAEPFEMALSILRSRFGMTIAGDPGMRVRIAELIASEPQRPVLRSVTRFLYTALLCDGPREQARYATRAVLDRFIPRAE